MQVPLELSFHGVPHTDWVEDYVRDQVGKIERFAENITACRVAIECPHQQKRSGNSYRVRVELTLPPKKDLVAAKERTVTDTHEQLRPLIRDTFGALERQVKQVAQLRRENVKVHEEPRALVVRLFEKEGYGFIQTEDGMDYYFHQNSVLNNDFDRLEIGTEVRFAAEMGDKGPQASSVQIVNKPGSRTSPDTPTREDIPAGWEKH